MAEKKKVVTTEFQELTRKILVIQSCIAGAFFASFIAFSIINKAINLSFMLVVILYLALLFLFFMVFVLYRRQIVSDLSRNEKESLTANLISMDSLVQIIVKLFFMLEKASTIENDPKLKQVLIKSRGNIETLEKAVMDWWKIKDFIENKNDITNVHGEYNIRQINQTISHSGTSIIDAVDLFTKSYHASSEKIKKSQTDLSTLIYYLSNSIPLISDFSDSSNTFSRDTIKEVITLFEDIARFSMHISQDIQQKMQDLMDAEKSNSLVFIIQQTRILVEDFEEFFLNLEKLKNVSNNFVDTSIDKLNNIAEFAVSIEDIAETIKVISLNVSIEAANTGSSARGFQVLARDLRVFAQKTLKFAGDVKSRVQDTIESTEGLKGEYLDNMNIVYDFVKEMKESIVSFKSIIESTFERIKEIITVLQGFANKIDDGLKHIIGKLQYYDITSQEIEHLSAFIENIFDTAKQEANQIHLEDYISSDQRKEIQRSILESVGAIITTRNERNILQKYEEIYGISISEEADNVHSDSIGDESIILF